MAWVRTPDDLWEREEAVTVGIDAVAFHLAALAYSNRNLTDGRIPPTKTVTLLAVADPRALVERLVAAGWWTADETGYHLVYLQDLQPTAESVRAKREATARRVSEYRARSNSVTNTERTRSVPALPGTRSRSPVPGSPDPEPGPAPEVLASGGTRDDVAEPPPKNPTRTDIRLARIIDLVKQAGVTIYPTSRDGRVLKSCAAPAELIAAAYCAAARREWDPVGDGFISGNLSLHLVIDRLAGYQAEGRSYEPASFLESRYGRLPARRPDPADVAF